jgi:hypothetical protein
MENREISPQEVRVWSALQDDWHTNEEIAQATSVARRTVANHTKRFVELGLAEVAVTWPSRRFRAKKGSRENRDYVARLAQAKELHGL